MDRRKRKAASWPVAPFHGIGIVGYRMTALRQRPEFVFDELLINTFDPSGRSLFAEIPCATCPFLMLLHDDKGRFRKRLPP
jgi:hypothetical protein